MGHDRFGAGLLGSKGQWNIVCDGWRMIAQLMQLDYLPFVFHKRRIIKKVVGVRTSNFLSQIIELWILFGSLSCQIFTLECNMLSKCQVLSTGRHWWSLLASVLSGRIRDLWMARTYFFTSRSWRRVPWRHRRWENARWESSSGAFVISMSQDRTLNHGMLL